MKSILIDAGPLIALFDKRDHFHDSVILFLPEIKDRLITTWPVIAEVCYMLSFSVPCQLDFLTWCDRGALRIEDISESDIKRIAVSNLKCTKLLGVSLSRSLEVQDFSRSIIEHSDRLG